MHIYSNYRSTLRKRPESSGEARTALTVAAAVAAIIGGLGVPGLARAQTDNQNQTQTQSSGSDQLQEIVVTATRRAENLQDVPVSVQAFTEKQMDKQGIRDIGDIAAFTPSLSYTATDGLRTLNNRISIRGVSSDVGGATTGIYIDDTPIAIRTLRTNGDPSATAFPQLFDVQRVEVLRGPQGTLFGSGSEGGTVRFITPEPSLTGSSVYARFGASTTHDGAPSFEAGVAGGAPLIEDKLGFRASVSSSGTGGFVNHGDYYTGQIDQANYNWQKAFNLRVALKWLATDQLTISPSYYHQQIFVNGNSGFSLPDNTDGVNTTDPAYVKYYQSYGGRFHNFSHFGDTAASGNYISSEGTIGSSDQYMDLYAVNFKYSLPKVDFIYNPSVYDNRQDNVSDFTFISFQILPTFFGGGPIYFPTDPGAKSPEYDNQHNRAVTHEFRVQNSDPDARFNWVVGAYLFNQTLFSHSAIDNQTFGLVLPQAIPGFTPAMFGCTDTFNCNPLAGLMYQGRYGIWLDTNAWNKEKAIFGQTDITLTKHLTATVGLRYSKMEFQSELFSAGIFDGIPGVTEDNTSKMNLTTPKYGLKWTFEDGKMIYVSAAKGGRNGGVNQIGNIKATSACLTRLNTVWGISDPDSLKYYQGDSVWSYELGTKFQALNNRLSVDADVYQIDWNNMIRSVGIGGNGCFFSYTANLGKAQSRGAELTIQYLPIDSLTLTAAAGYAKVQSANSIYVPDPNQPDGHARNAQGQLMYVTRDGAILDGSNTTLTLAAQYAFTAFTKPSYARADFRYVGAPKKGDAWDPNSSQYAGANNLFAQPILKTVNLRLGTQLSDWDVSLYANNLTNTQPIQMARLGNLSDYSGAWMSGTVMTRPREMGFTAIYRY